MKSKPAILLLFFLIAIIIICYSGYAFYNYVLQSEKHQANTNISHTAGLKISQIINWKNERISDAAFIQHNTSINRQIYTYLNNPRDNFLKQEIIDWIKELKENHEYVDIILIDLNYKANSLFGSNDQLQAIDSIFLKSSFEERKIQLGGAYKEIKTGRIYLGTFIPLMLNTEIFGYMKIKIDPKVNFYPLIEAVPSESKTAETFIVRRDGDSITYLHDLRFKKNTALTFKLPVTKNDLPAAMAAQGKSGIVEGIDYNGTEVLAYVSKIEGTNWHIISKISMNEVYAPVRKQALFIILGVIGLIAILGLTINSLWKNQKVQYLHSQLNLEKELQKSREQFKSVVETAMDGVITVDENQRVTLYNKASEKIFGIPAEEAIGMSIEKFIPERFHEAHKQDIRHFAKESPETRYMGKERVITGRRANGEELLMEASISHFEIEGQKYFTVIHRDVTSRKRMEEALLQSEARFRDLAESMPQIVWTAKADGTVDYYSKQINELEGITVNEGGVWEWAPVVHQDDIQKTTEAWQYAISTGTPYEIIHRIKKKAGGYKWFLSRAIPIKNENGEILRWYGTSTDISLQKEAEEKLKISETRFRDLIETQQEMIVRINTAGEFTFVNDAFCRKFGVNKDEFTGSSFIPLVHPDDLLIASEKMREMLHPPYRATAEIREYTAEGICWIEWYGTGITNSEGRVIEFQAVGRDVTGLKKTQEELRESERQFRTLAENSPEVIARFDKNLRHTFLNKYGSKVYGVPQEEVIGKTNADLGMPADKVDFWNSYFEEVLKAGKQQSVEFDFQSPNFGHQYFSSLFVPEFNAHGEVESILAITRDISERKSFEEKLRESEQRIKNKLESIISPEGDIGKLELAEIIDTAMIQNLMDNFYKVANIPMSIVDLKGNILVGVGWQKICTEFHRVHPESHKYCIESDLELSAGVLPGEFKLYKCKNNMWDLSSPIMIGGNHVGNLFIGQFYFDKDEIDYKTFREQARKYGFNEDEYISALESVPRLSEETVAAGLEFFIKLSNMISKLSFSNIQLARIVAERDKLLNSLRIIQDDLKRSNKDLEQFAYISSHDLQEPIRMISSYAQLIKMKNKNILESSTDEFLGFIIEGAARMQQLIDDLLKYSRITTSREEFEDVDCNMLIKNILADLKFRIEDENAVIDIDELPVVKGNSTQLRQLFQNFIINALKFRNEKRPEIKISCEKKDGKWLFSIKDNGIGIEKQYYERIFVIFQRLHDRDKYPGSGIGLALCKKIIERHGGQVFVESEPGNGTVFYFTLAA